MNTSPPPLPHGAPRRRFYFAETVAQLREMHGQRPDDAALQIASRAVDLAIEELAELHDMRRKLAELEVAVREHKSRGDLAKRTLRIFFDGRDLRLRREGLR